MLRTFRRSAARARNQVACRLHAVLCGLVPGGASKEITATHATRILEQVTPPGAVARARCELAAEFPANLRRLDTQLRESKKKLALVVRASGTTLTGIFGVGPVIAATVIGDVGDVSRFPSRDRFAAYNGTAPVEVSSGDRKIYRLSRRGNRRLNHTIHMAAVTQIRQRTATAAPTTTRRSLRARLTKRRSATSPATTGNSWSPTARSSSARCCLSTRPAARFNRRLRSAARAAGWPPAWGPPVRARWRSGLACRRC